MELNKLDILIDNIYKYSDHSDKCDLVNVEYGNCNCGYNQLFDDFRAVIREHKMELINISKAAFKNAFFEGLNTAHDMSYVVPVIGKSTRTKDEEDEMADERLMVYLQDKLDKFLKRNNLCVKMN